MDLEEVAAAYEAMANDPDNLTVRASYAAFIQAIDAQFASIPVKVAFVDADPYASSQAMREDVAKGQLLIYKGGSIHPILTPEQNWRFRAVHDYYCHALPGNSFSPKGEYEAWKAHRAMLSPFAWLALACETRGQAAFYAVHKKFAPQKVGILPARYI